MRTMLDKSGCGVGVMVGVLVGVGIAEIENGACTGMVDCFYSEVPADP